VASGKCHAAVIPIENTLHGSIHENYDHLLRYDLPIRGETFVRIVHNLIAAPGVRFRDIRRIYSHPVALNQCRRFLEEHTETERITLYDKARILRKSIEDDRENYTRFFLLERPKKNPKTVQPTPAGPFKTTVVFTVRNVAGTLFRCLSAFALRDLNMTKIESRPLRGKPWEYLFYLDFLGHKDDAAVRNALGHLGELADTLKVLGCYPSATKPV
jgi:prephenate dehydratase